MPDKILLVDGNNILNRAYYGVPPLTNSKGEPTGAVYGFMNILYKYIEQENPVYLGVAFDLKEPTFRHKMFAEYKGTRKPAPEDLIKQMPVIKDLLRASNISVLELPGYEADDIIGTLSVTAEKAGLDTIVLSGDRDLFQLVTDKVTQYIPHTKSGATTTDIYTPQKMMEVYGVTPKEFIDVKALQGDSSDNIPGVPGVGEKTAQALISTYHSLEQIKEHIEEVKPTRAKNAIAGNFDIAILSRDLARIALDAPVKETLEDMKIGNIFTSEAYEMFGSLEIKKLMKKFSSDANIEHKPSVNLPATNVIELSNMDTSEADAAFENACGKELALAYEEILNDRHIIFTTDGKNVYDIKIGWLATDEYIGEKLASLAAAATRKNPIIISGLQKVLRDFGLNESDAFFDVEIAAYLLNPLKSTYNYEDIARDYLGNSALPSKAEIFDKKKMPTEDSEIVKTYIGHLALVPFAAKSEVERLLKDAGMENLFYDIEMPTAFKLHTLEANGIKVNRDDLREFGKKLTVEILKLEKEIYKIAGEEFNINSPKQLGEILFDKLGLPGAKKTKSGYSTAADVLEKLKDDNPIVNKVLEYRTYAKLKSTYAEGLDAFIENDGRIHGHFLQTVTATGRISSAEPNLQNIPVREQLGREIRKVFVPKEGCVFVDADYSQIELRVLAHLSKDERLINAYSGGEDIHKITASEAFGVPLNEVTSEQRRAAKAVNFGIVYGESAFGLAGGLGISRKEANEYIERYFSIYPGVKEFLDKQVLNAKNKGYVTTLYGRRRPVPELKSSNFMQRQFGERVAMNSPIQGTAADIMKLAMIDVSNALAEGGYKSQIVLQVHDELLLEVPFEEKEAVINLLKEKMSGVANLSVPLTVSVESGSSWFETK